MKHIGHYMRSRTRWARLLVLCSAFVIGGICHFYFNFDQVFWNSCSKIPRLKSGDSHIHIDETWQHSGHSRHLLQTNLTGEPSTDQGTESTTARMNVTTTAQTNGIYPLDIFSVEQKKNGAIVLHIILMVYMFVALAIVCDEFFVPALSVITDKLSLSDDVAGATFMAAGGSAPELFTSLIGVFIAQSDVGVGTIVGSAVFNILFVIGMCATFSKGVLSLTWWPLFRDCLFYSISLSLLLYSFSDTRIEWYESLCLLLIYILYVLFMKFNVPIERWVKSRLLRKKVSAIKENDRRVSLPHFRNNASMFRHGALQLMLHTLDPLSDSDVVEDKAMQLQVMAKTQQKTGLPQATGNGKSQQPNEQPASRPESARSNQKLTISYHNGYTNGDIIMDEPTQITTVSQACDSPLSVKTGNGITLTPLPPLNGHHQNITDVDQLGTDATHLQMNKPTDHMKGNGNGLCETTIIVNGATNGGTNTDSNVGPIANGVDQQFEKSTEQLTANADVNNVESQESTDQPDMADMEVEEPLDISWPQGWRKRVTYILLAPLVYLLYFTLPDVRRMESRRWYYITFIGSILWIAGFSYLMVWMAKEVGDTIGFEERVMGLTFLAAGTSIPDLITSVIVARKGLGDMAVSSSVGSNIFDITVGLPFPWILWSLSRSGTPVPVDSRGLFCSIFLLFGMLILVVILIAVNKWRMTKVMGGFMFLFYIAFLAISLLLLADTIPCIIGA